MVKREQDGGPAFEGSFEDLLFRTGGAIGDTPAIRAERERLAALAAEEKAKRDAARKAYQEELRETAWAARHLNYPENTRGFGPWANEQISWSEARKGSILGFGFVDNPLDETEAERRVQLARQHNLFRRNVRDAFNAGQTKEQIAAGAGDWSQAATDLQLHYLGHRVGAPVSVTPAAIEAAKAQLPWPLNIVAHLPSLWPLR